MRILIIFLLICCALCKKSNDQDKPDWAKKDIRDYRYVYQKLNCMVLFVINTQSFFSFYFKLCVPKDFVKMPEFS